MSNPELVRYGINRIKLMAKNCVPCDLPADSFIEEAVKDIIKAVQENANEILAEEEE